ncbi:serine-rich adhesin for platelets-like isoform X2 [Watersipora subatra]|uniref:serine-rich adhesin for platelets-like isoform X2 n=1 Tax=Watersipora subatra TaxID=2589382 RepID=UPI00355BAE29
MFFNPGLKFLLIAFVTLGIWVHATAGQDNTTQPINSILNATITVAEIKHQNQTGTTLSSPNATTSDRTTPQSEVNGTQSMTTTSPPTSTAYTSSNSVTTVLESQRLNGTTVTTAGLKTSAATLGISDGAHSDSEVIRTSAISSLAITNITDPTSTMPISTTHSGGSTSITVGLAMTSTCGTTCSIKCELGRKVDDKGCPLCACVDSSDMPANIEKILQEFWWIFLIAVLILIIVIIIVAVWCWYKKRNIEQQERERVARHCPTDTMLKANSAFHLALQQQSTAYNDDDTLEVQRRYRADISNNVLAGPEDRETVFDDFHNEQQMKSFFQMSQRKQEHSPESVRSTNKQTQTSTACGENRMLPDVVGSSALHSFNDDEIEPDLHFKASQDSFDGIDYHRSMPGTPTKLTEL